MPPSGTDFSPVSDVIGNLDRAPLASSGEGDVLKGLILRCIHYRTTHDRVEGDALLADDHAPIERLMDASFRRVRKNLRLERQED